MPNLNLCVLIGNVTRRPEMNEPKRDLLIAKFGLAVNSKHGEREETLFIDVTCFNRLAEIVDDYVGEGDPVAIEGRLVLDQWEDKETGAKRSKIHLIADKLQMLGGKKDDGRGRGREDDTRREDRGGRGQSRGGGERYRDDRDHSRRQERGHTQSREPQGRESRPRADFRAEPERPPRREDPPRRPPEEPIDDDIPF